MQDKFTIQTNLVRTVVLGVMAGMVVIVFFWINRSTTALLVLILLLGIFLQYVLSKKIFRIIADGQKVTFEYLQLQKKTITYDRELLQIKKRIEVHFRGGKNEIYEIYNKNHYKKIFEVNKRSFKSDRDYKIFTDLFDISDR